MISKIIGYALIVIGLLALIFGIYMWSSLPNNPFAVLFAIPLIVAGLIILGIGAIAAKK